MESSSRLWRSIYGCLVLSSIILSTCSASPSSSSKEPSSHTSTSPASIPLSSLPFRRSPASLSKAKLRDGETPYQTFFYQNQTLDHFNFATRPLTYNQRYLVSEQYWDGKGPLLFYTGNEGDITSFWNNTGFVTTTLAQTFSGLVIFAEHRYYGESLPYGIQSFTKDNIKYLTTEQALADFAQLIGYLKDKYNAHNSAVIAFGGSYGGMLSSWFRLKYPNVVDGAIAASAPVLLFLNTGVSQWSFNEIIANDYEEVSPACPSLILSSLNAVTQMASTQQGAANLSRIFHLCDTLQPRQAGDFLYWLENAFTSMAMADYPYPCDFLGPMPGWPVNVSCQTFLNTYDQSGDLLSALYDSVSVYYNYSGSGGSCFSLTSTAEGGDIAWSYQACTEMIFPISSNGTSDMFPPDYFDLQAIIATCQATFGVISRPNWITTTYGGALSTSDPSNPNNIKGSNIVYSNGMLDPWGSGGVLSTISDEKDMVSVFMSESAHHLDLRLPNSEDPDSVQNGRQTETQYIQEWLDSFSATRSRKQGTIAIN